MSDPVTTARTAREHLSRGLSALQSSPNVPPALLELAAPIAQSMGALHQIERSQGQQLMPHADVALNNVRQALSAMQAVPAQHPAIGQAVEAVAASLSLVHSLAKLAQGAPPPQAQAARPPTAAQPQAQPPPPAPAPPPAPPSAPAMRAQPPAQQPMAASDPFAAPPAGHKPPGPSIPVPSPPVQGGMQVFTADLGAHSVTNFYKGLSGNDVIDHGGLFVSTYMLPKIGAPIRLKVSLPGGYEFEANAVVKWARDESGAGADAPPGFGAQFTQITPEARQLVYRYVRNREPLFHDDL